MKKEFDALDWSDRFREAGGNLRLDAVKIWISESPNTDASRAIWEELRGPGAYDDVHALIRSKFPKDYRIWYDWPERTFPQT